MEPSEKTGQAIRRSTRLPLEIPVLVTSLNAGVSFSEPCNTTLVNAHGCGLIVPRPLAYGTHVRLEIVSAKRHTTARVAEVVPLGGDPETWLVGLDLDVPGNFWGIEYAPADWKMEEVALPAPGQDLRPANPEPDASKSAAPRRWRLTDISAGACYLETPTPFPAETPVLLSVRTLDTEVLLEGVVSASHAQKGMGVEFTEAPEHDRRAKVEGLIGRLMGNREAPRIFVGRKEARKEVQKEVRKPARRSPPKSVSGAEFDEAPPDPLLELVREGASLTAEQFFNALQTQRLGRRRDPRMQLALPVLLTGTDVNGRPLNQRVITVNISRRGALLDGVHGRLEQGGVISLARLRKQEEFRVAWVGEDGTAAEGQVGVEAVDPNSSFWDEVLGAMAKSAHETGSVDKNARGTGR